MSRQPIELIQIKSGHAERDDDAVSNMLPAQEPTMKLSARNQLKGNVIEARKGETTAHVRIDLGGGNVVTASITNEAVDDLALKPGDSVVAIVKASNVLVGK
jgi:molybdopterin-binding protein